MLAAPAAAPAYIEASSETHAQLVNQERIIVRTVEATIVVTDVQGSTDRITALARELDGWVVIHQSIREAPWVHLLPCSG